MNMIADTCTIAFADYPAGDTIVLTKRLRQLSQVLNQAPPGALISLDRTQCRSIQLLDLYTILEFLDKDALQNGLIPFLQKQDPCRLADFAAISNYLGIPLLHKALVRVIMLSLDTALGDPESKQDFLEKYNQTIPLEMQRKIVANSVFLSSPGSKAAAVSRSIRSLVSASAVSGRQDMLVPEGTIVTVSWSRDSKFLAACSDSHTVAVWNTYTGEMVKKWNHHKGLPSSVLVDDTAFIRWGEDNSQLSLYSWDQTVRIFTFPSAIKISEQRASSIPFNFRGLRVSKVMANAHIKNETSAQSDEFSQPNNFMVSAYKSHDGTKIASYSENGILCIWHQASGTLLARIKAHEKPIADSAFNHGLICGVCWSPDDKKLASYGAGGEIYIWDIQVLIQQYKKNIALNFDQFFLAEKIANAEGTSVQVNETSQEWDLFASLPSELQEALSSVHT